VVAQLARFVINGVMATTVNYAVLVILVEGVRIEYVGVAGLLSAFAGIVASFIGNRVYVFRSQAPLLRELFRFKTLYLFVALFQALFLALWSDVLEHDYNLGFILVTGVGVLISYYGNKIFVFR